MLSYQEIVDGLLAIGVAPERAAEQARRQCQLHGQPIPEPDPEPARADLVLEKDEQAECYKRFRAFGGTVRNLSQARATKQAPGLGDAFVCFPAIGVAFWWETKRLVGGKHSPAQLEFRQDCEACGIRYETGDRHAAAELLVRLGLARLDGTTLEPARPSLPRTA